MFTPHALLVKFRRNISLGLSSVLSSKRAIQVNIAIMWVFVKLWEMMATHRELARRLQELERQIENHDQQILSIFEAIRALMSSPEKTRKRIGFEVKEPRPTYGKRRKRNYR